MKTKLSSFLILGSVPFLGVACVSRAPTECELDRRSGLYPSSYCDKDVAATPRERPALVGGAAATANTVPASLPIREQPVVAKVWVRDQILDGGHWMQGTWLFIEVEPSRWSGESIAATSAGSAGGARLGARRVPSRGRAFNPVSSSSSSVEPGPPASRSERGGAQ
jgi:hypothetical protein